MSKAFMKEDDGGIDDEGADAVAPALPAGSKNYITPRGFAALREERERLVRVERPEVVRVVSWAAANGDRSENGDYLYGKRRLREIDRRLRFLGKRMESAEVVDPGKQIRRNQVFFGATVTYANMRDEEHTITIVGVDEVDSNRGLVSWVSPVARALLKARVGDTVSVRTPSGVEQIEVLRIAYPAGTA
ncbi:MAG: transcription elongation factor GreB [Alphaproteobacteria bacterium]|nr:transcription elongation factor GreB [Alphaproteobacteria bacterium]MCW5744465.1 transcription elongation factor GreB [Alphaproteobacteria bacterium]